MSDLISGMFGPLQLMLQSLAGLFEGSSSKISMCWDNTLGEGSFLYRVGFIGGFLAYVAIIERISSGNRG